MAQHHFDARKNARTQTREPELSAKPIDPAPVRAIVELLGWKR